MPIDKNPYFGRHTFHSHQTRKILKNSFDVYEAEMRIDASIKILRSCEEIEGCIEGQYIDGNYCLKKKVVSSEITDNDFTVESIIMMILLHIYIF